MRDFEQPRRSLVVAREAMAATSHPSATLAAVRILAAGGNAMDAAIAASAVQCVVEPGSTGIGGDCFALISREGSGEIVAYNGSGCAPAATRPNGSPSMGSRRYRGSRPHAVTVPGAIDAWTTAACRSWQIAVRGGSGAGNSVCRGGLRHLTARSSRLDPRDRAAVGGPCRTPYLPAWRTRATRGRGASPAGAWRHAAAYRGGRT